MVLPRVGAEPLFASLDELARNGPRRPVTTEQFEALLSAKSGKDLGDFFDYWVYGGFRPRIDGRWAQSGSRIVGELRSDVPFGTFDVPVVVRTEVGERELWVRVVDGIGRFEVPVRDPKTVLVLDPNHRVLARSRAMRKVASLDDVNPPSGP
jgi:hypothetical protein